MFLIIYMLAQVREQLKLNSLLKSNLLMCKFVFIVLLVNLSNVEVVFGAGEYGSWVNSIGSNARRLSINGQLLPAGGFYLPNSFVSDGGDNWSVFLHGISRVRNRRLRSGCEPDCSDAIAYAEYDVLKRNSNSLSLQLSLHSLSGRNGGTGFGEGSSLGFKYARRIGPTTALSFSGEHILQFDDTVDLGRNFYIGFSKFFDSSRIRYLGGTGAVINVGLGSGIYTVYDNELFSLSSAVGGNNIFDDSNRLSFGLVWSASYFLSRKYAVGMEFSGYGFGAGLSVKPFRKYPLTSTLFLYDVINDFPRGIPCAEDPCQPRLYGRLSYSF